MRCIWVSGKKALTESEAAQQIVSEARQLLQQDLALLGVEWNPNSILPEARTNSSDESTDSSLQSPSEGSSNEKNVRTEKLRKLVKGHHIPAGPPSHNCQSHTIPKSSTANVENPMDTEQQSSALHKVLKSISAKDKIGQNGCGTTEISAFLGNCRYSSDLNCISCSNSHYVSPLSKRRRVKDNEIKVDSGARVTEEEKPCTEFRQTSTASLDNYHSDSRKTPNITESQSTAVHQNCKTQTFCSSSIPFHLGKTQTLTNQPHVPSCDEKTFTDDVKNEYQDLNEMNRMIVSDKGANKGKYTDCYNKKSKGDDILRQPSPSTFAEFLVSSDIKCRVASEVILISGEKCNSPDLYTGELEEFGNSFHLDTQTERMLLQEDKLPHSIGNSNASHEFRTTHAGTEQISHSKNGNLVPEKRHEQKNNKDPNDGASLVSDDNPNELPSVKAKPKYNISLTDSQMENLLNFTNQTPESCEMHLNSKPQGQTDNSDTVTKAISEGIVDNSPNRSSSFLFDSLYDRSILEAMENEAGFAEESERDKAVNANTNSCDPSMALNVDNEVVLEVEDQEAVQWGESSFNLSEWGDSLLIGEHYLEKRNSGFKVCAGPKDTSSEAEKPGYTDDVSEIQVSQSDEPCSRSATNFSFHLSPGMQDIFDKWSDQFSTFHGPSGQTDANVLEQKVVSAEVEPEHARHKGSLSDDLYVVKLNSVNHDLIPPTPACEPRVKVATSAVQSPVNHQTRIESRLNSSPSSDPEDNQQLCVELKAMSQLQTSLTDEGFSLQLSQDASISGSNFSSPESFSIIDVASDKRLFETFVKEWKSKKRFSLAVACERKDGTVQPEAVIGNKFKKGNLCMFFF